MEKYVVSVTYGNALPRQLFASAITSREDAEKLKELALSLGYSDAEVLDARAFREILAERNRRRSDQARPNSGGGDVRGVREVAQSPPPRAPKRTERTERARDSSGSAEATRAR